MMVDPRLCSIALLCLAAATLVTRGSHAQQVPDSTFEARVQHPAFAKRHPRLLFDEAHLNFHTAGGRYKPFADLMRSDGYRVIPNHEPFTRRSLGRGDVLVIANAAGAGWDTDSTGGRPAFTPEECEAVHSWVEDGGALLLIADHAPFGTAAERLANRFGVDMAKGYTEDAAHADTTAMSASFIVHARENGLLADHAITRGRNASERIERVIAFTGQSLRGQSGSESLLPLGEGALDLAYRTFASPAARPYAVANATPAWGRVQGLALRVGKGRLVVLGEAAMLSAQMILQPGREGGPTTAMRFGMNRPGTDNRQFALNVMHWLSGILD